MILHKSLMPPWKELHPNMTPEQKKILERCYNPFGVTEKGMMKAAWCLGIVFGGFITWMIWFSWGKF